MRDEKQYICDRIWEYAEKDAESLKRIYDFMVVNCINYLEEASLKALEIVFRIETFMNAEKQVKNKIKADFEEVPECNSKVIIREREYYEFPINTWIWMPHAAHFIGAESCLFRMATVVGDFIVSTIGQYFHKEQMKEIGRDRFYETMVFIAGKSNDECHCCPNSIDLNNQYGPEGLETTGYNNSKAAFDGHMEMCHKYARLEVVK